MTILSDGPAPHDTTIDEPVLPGMPPWGPVDTPETEATPPRRPKKSLVALALAGVVVSAGVGAGVATWAGNDSGSSGTASSGILQSSGTAISAAANGTTEAAAAALGPSIVTIEVTGTETVSSGNQFFGGGQQQQSVSDTGSGIVLRTDGYILTNNHVVAAAESSGSVHVTFSDGKTVAATIVGYDATSDLAVIKVSGVSDLKAATFADSDALKVGQAVIAVGAPLGLSNTVTEGIVSTTHRPVATGEAGASQQSVIDAVQTDAAINPGNSGGALADLSGRVVGINSAIASTGSTDSTSQSGNIGVGFAIPSNDAIKVANQLISTGHATHSIIGINLSDNSDSVDTTGVPGTGATVGTVASGGAAANAGIQAGDVITKVGDRTVTDNNSLIVAVRSHDPGTKVDVTYTRNGSTKTVSVTLGSAQS